MHIGNQEAVLQMSAVNHGDLGSVGNAAQVPGHVEFSLLT